MGLKFDNGYTEDYVVKMIDELHERVTGECLYYPEGDPDERAWWKLRVKVILDSTPIIIEEDVREVEE